MRNKLALTIALACFAFATALGVGLAGAEPATDESSLPQATTPTVPAPPAPPLPLCSNGLDDDGDGLADLSDPDCLNDPSGASEEPAPGAPPAEIVAPPVEAPAAKETLEVGSSLEAGKAKDSDAKHVVENQSLGGSAGGGAVGGGGVAAPPATAGVQPQAIGASGGSAYLDGGSPAAQNPTLTISPFGPAPIGVPNFVIDSFEIPPFLLPIYQACGTEYGIPWQVLASINKIETAFGTNLNVSSAGAMGWMQFIPSSWEMYGVDANGDGRKDPYNPVDAICAAGNYLKAAGAAEDLYDAIFAYNHADWYVQEVLLYAQAYGKLPADLIGSLTGLTQGAHFPVAADASYADDISARAALERATPGERKAYGNAADVITSSPTRRGINIFAAEGAPVVAVNDGVIQKSGNSKKLGRYIVLQDAYGNRYTYAKLGEIVRDGRKVVMPTGDEKRVPVDSEDIRAAALRAPRAQRRRSAEGGCRESRYRGLDRRRRKHQERLEGDRRHRPRPGRQGRRGRRPAHQLLDQAGRPGRPADRPEADPRRLEAARGDRDLPRQGQRRARERGSAAPASCCSPRRRCSDGCSPITRSNSPNATESKSAPARSTGACWRRSPTSPSRASA